ncbi:isthmin-2 [Denticeps clupeoides]|uniref:AMOP domain-containing protein n=1 Tax=Denticeps clupeoides TaxID=299321 RepID=A0AAY4E039_9TELE|nr:isthmin-2-like [Denticeps clupeoides]
MILVKDCMLLSVFFVACFGVVRGFPRHIHGQTDKLPNGLTEEASPHTGPRNSHLHGAHHQENQVQSVLSEPHLHKRRWHQHRSVGVLPRPEPEEETEPFVLDLKNFPDLANADISSQNPNIQVSIEVVDDPQMEMDLAKDNKNSWPLSSSSASSSPSSSSATVDWLGGKKLFWPLFWGYADTADSSEDGTGRSGLDDLTEEEDGAEDYLLEYDSGEPVPSGVGGDWDSPWNKGWDPTQSYYENVDNEEWSSWSPCNATCGHGNQVRTRSCGYSCVATESRVCDLDPCPDDVNQVTDRFPFEMENGSEPFGSDVDSCQKWLNCKSEFLQRYLQQVMEELPSCPCTYPEGVAHNVVGVFDEIRGRTFQWRDASSPKERLDVYKPSARACIRSVHSGDSATLAAQHCCYNDRSKLITRGKSAGMPNLISTDFSPELHFKVDVLPWILCKGDWSRFHVARPPNNGLQCAENPHEDVFMNELEEAREY